jgi:hypothetical protein
MRVLEVVLGLFGGGGEEAGVFGVVWGEDDEVVTRKEAAEGPVAADLGAFFVCDGGWVGVGPAADAGEGEVFFDFIEVLPCPDFDEVCGALEGAAHGANEGVVLTGDVLGDEAALEFVEGEGEELAHSVGWWVGYGCSKPA